MTETISYGVLRDTCVLLCRERGNSVAQALLWEFGYKLADLPSSLWPEFVRVARHLITSGGGEEYRDAIREMIVQCAAEDVQRRLLASLNAAMIARDGPAKPQADWNPIYLQPAPKSTAKPALSALLLCADLEPRGYLR